MPAALFSSVFDSYLTCDILPVQPLITRSKPVWETAMKKTTLLNQPISAVIAGLGHTDTLVIADAGLPVPATTERIDLAVTHGIPSFLDTLDAVLSEMQVERAIVAEEMSQVSPEVFAAVQKKLSGVPIDRVPHQAFKTKTGIARAVVRTGEFTAYANIILVSGVVF